MLYYSLYYYYKIKFKRIILNLRANQTKHSLYVINCCNAVTNSYVITLNVVIDSCCKIVS